MLAIVVSSFHVSFQLGLSSDVGDGLDFKESHSQKFWVFIGGFIDEEGQSS